MRAAIYRGQDRPLAIETLPDPLPGPGEVVIRVGRCGICGTDLAMTAPGPIQYEIGSALGHEFAGEVVAVGKGVETLRSGDLLTAMPLAGCGHCGECRQGDPFFCAAMRPAMGGFGEYTIVRQETAIRLPEGLSLTDGAIVEPLAVGLHGARLAGVAPGSAVLVLGAGPIGLSAAFWAWRLGAGSVTIIARSDRHEAIARNMGATDFLSFEAVAGRPVAADIVIECIGVPGMIERAVGLVRPRGTVLILGLCLHRDSWAPGAAAFKQVRLQTSIGYSFADFTAALDALGAGAVAPRAMVSETIPLDALPMRFEGLRTDRDICKMLVDPWAGVVS